MAHISARLDGNAIRAALDQHPFVTEVVFSPRADSTNRVTKGRAARGAPEGLLVITEEQTAGRGRLGRRWWAPAGSALLTSLLFRPAPYILKADRLQAINSLKPGEAEAYAPQQLVMLCALAAADAITQRTGLSVHLKWPNDLLIGKRKVAGLLAESIYKADRPDSVIVGMGLNVNTDLSTAPFAAAAATSLSAELGHELDRLELLTAYVDNVARRYAGFKAGASPVTEWASRLVTLGQPVTAHLAGDDTSGTLPERLDGFAEGVEESGALLLRTADGQIHRLFAADVSLRDVEEGA
jgi:BirA family biotin operon repressor/biotin-[acetyl-CoA-carboxylase] ligase